MNRTSAIIIPVQVLLTVCVIVMGVLIETSWLGLLGVAILGLSAIAQTISKTPTPEKGRNWPLLGALAGTVVVPISYCFTKTLIVWDSYHGWMAWLVALVILLAAFGRAGAETAQARLASKRNWRILGLAWAFMGCALHVIGSYLLDDVVTFCLGVLASLFLFILCRVWFRPGSLGAQVLNTLILVFIALPVTDLVLRLRSMSGVNSSPENYYSYEAAQKNPAGYALWTRYVDEQWVHLAKDIFLPAPDRDPPFRLRPGGKTVFFKCPITVNQLGFRGRECSREKGDVYRIVAMGESTTFGATLKPDDRPWPEVLEALIHERLKTPRPVEIINAGVPSYNLETSLRRFSSEILPLQPDMIISYHGYNGFKFIDGALPPPVGKAPPVYRDRPLKLLGDFEYGLKLMHYKKSMTPATGPAKAAIAPPMETRYAKDYREFGNIARSNHIRLVVGSYSMAVNSNSDRALIEFYRGPYPHVREQIQANAIHSEIVRGFAREYPEICAVDTHPQLDGEHDKFIDLVHLTQPGRQQLAEAFFQSIRPVLEQELSPKN